MINKTVLDANNQWKLLILREALRGSSRFQHYQNNLAIDADLLTQCLASLVKSGFLKRFLVCDRPPRHEYRPTARAREFEQIIMASFVFAMDPQSQGGLNIAIINRVTGEVADPLLIDRRSGQIITAEEYTFAPVSATQGEPRPSNVLPIKTTGGANAQ